MVRGKESLALKEMVRGEEELTAIQSIPQGTSNSNNSGGAAATKAKFAESDDRLRKLEISLPVDISVPLLSLQPVKFIREVIK